MLEVKATAKYIRKGDVVCLLQGAAKPSVIRLHRDYCAVIAIAVTPTNNKRIAELDIDWPDSLRPTTNFPRDFLLVWDWEKPLGESQHQEYKALMETNSREQEHSKVELGDHLDKVTRIRTPR